MPSHFSRFSSFSSPSRNPVNNHDISIPKINIQVWEGWQCGTVVIYQFSPWKINPFLCMYLSLNHTLFMRDGRHIVMAKIYFGLTCHVKTFFLLGLRGREQEFSDLSGNDEFWGPHPPSRTRIGSHRWDLWMRNSPGPFTVLGGHLEPQAWGASLFPLLHIQNTRMHSSRVRTGRSLTVSRSLLPGESGPGGSGPGGSALGRGVSALGGSGLGGGGGGIPACTEADPPLLTESQTPVKTLPWPNFVAAGKYSINYLYRRMLNIVSWETTVL